MGKTTGDHRLQLFYYIKRGYKRFTRNNLELVFVFSTVAHTHTHTHTHSLSLSLSSLSIHNVQLI